GIGQSQQSHVRDHFEFELEGPLLPRQAGTELARRAVGARLEALVAPATLAAAGHQQLLDVAGQIAEHLLGVGVAHHGADRHRHVKVRAAAAGAVVGAAGLAVAGLEGALDAEVGEGVYPGGGAQEDAAAVAAVAAVRAAERHELLAPEAGAAPAAVAGLHPRPRLIDELHALTLAQTKTPAPGRGRGGSGVRAFRPSGSVRSRTGAARRLSS